MAEPITALMSDTQSSLVETRCVVIYSPSGRGRKRFPDNCVTIYPDPEAALAAANPEKGFHAALASGPSRSSEGFFLYYLVRWLG